MVWCQFCSERDDGRDGESWVRQRHDRQCIWPGIMVLSGGVVPDTSKAAVWKWLVKETQRVHSSSLSKINGPSKPLMRGIRPLKNVEREWSNKNFFPRQNLPSLMLGYLIIWWLQPHLAIQMDRSGTGVQDECFKQWNPSGIFFQQLSKH
jgi:hypothetical protein